MYNFDSFMILVLPSEEPSFSFHLFKICFMSSNKILQFNSYRSYGFLVKLFFHCCKFFFLLFPILGT